MGGLLAEFNSLKVSNKILYKALILILAIFITFSTKLNFFLKGKLTKS